MKNTPGPRPTSPALHNRKRKSSAAVSPARRMRRQYDASQQRTSRSPVREDSQRRDEAQPSRGILNVDGPRSLASAKPVHTRGRTTTGTGWPTRGTKQPPPASASATALAHVPVTQRAAPASAPPATGAFNHRPKVESPTPGLVTAFLRSIELPGGPSSNAPPLQPGFSLDPSARPPLPVESACKSPPNRHGNGYQVSLVYKGFPFTYDLASLPNDPKGTIALLAITQSDPGAYILVGAHYRRTGRSRAACAVIRSLLDTLDTPCSTEKPGDDASMGSLTATLPSADPAEPVDPRTRVLKHTAVRPAMLLLAACELDISRESPDDSESTSHASAAHDLFRAVYGTVNDAILAGAARPQLKNALGLEFAGNGSSLRPSGLNGHPLPSQPTAKSRARVKDLEKDLSTAHAAQKKLKERLTVSNNRLMRAEDKVYALESRSREVYIQLDASRDENWRLRQRLAESEQKARELAQSTPNVENRVWGKLKDLFENLGGGMRGE